MKKLDPTLLVASALSLLAVSDASAHEAGAVTYVRQDTDRTLVISPQAHAVATPTEGLGVEANYAADAWTSASIDIRTGATQVVHEVRHQLELGADWEAGGTTTGVGYRFSTENDYESQGGHVEVSRSMAGNNTVLTARGNFLFDRIEQVGDPTFQEQLWTASGRLGYYQVLTPSAWAQLTYELRYLDGYQASPYRSVGIDGSGLGCQGSSVCLRENVPRRRLQQALALAARQALGERWSLGGEYRFYVDDWGLLAHTLEPRVAWLFGPSGMLVLRYRFHYQGAANFYEERYTRVPQSGFVTRDRELSHMVTHRVGLDATTKIAAGARSRVSLGLSLGLGRFLYPDFIGLTAVTAGEVAVSAGVEF